MITDEGRVKVADFGVAWIESSTMTQVGARLGTPAYMSPEQHQGLPISGRSDLFSAGVILYQFLTGERPFTGSSYPLIQQILLQDPVAPSQRNPDLPRALDAVTMKALAKRPEDRFATAREFADAFRKAATGESVATDFDLVLSDEALPANGFGAIPGAEPLQGTTTARATGDSGSNLGDVSLEAELEYWKEIKNSSEVTDFRTFLQLFPNSRFAPLARRRMSLVEAEAQPQREAERTQLLAAVDAERAAEQNVRNETGEPDRQAPKPSRRAKARARRQREAERHLQRIEPKEPKLVLVGSAANELTPDFELSPGAVAQPALDMVGLPRFQAITGPLDARRSAGNELAQDAPANRVAPAAARKPPRLPIALMLAAALVGTGIWSATRPELSPLVSKLRTQAGDIVTQLEQQWQAGEVAQAQQGKTGEAKRQAEEQRKKDEALKAERNRQLELTRQKEEAAKAAANQSYQHALALLNQGRSSEAVRQLRQLAKDGHGPAAKTLGDLYSKGEEVLLDMQEAAYFYAIAERNGVTIDHPAFARR
jgi:hypothetical protein